MGAHCHDVGTVRKEEKTSDSKGSDARTCLRMVQVHSDQEEREAGKGGKNQEKAYVKCNQISRPVYIFRQSRTTYFTTKTLI